MKGSSPYEIRLTRDAERDLAGIHRYIAVKGSTPIADRLLSRLRAKAQSLREFPERVPVAPELAALGMQSYRQLVHPPYRLIYRVAGDHVLVVLIADGRRDMRTLLAQRLTSA